MMSNMLCPICQKHTFKEIGAYEACPICGWIDDPIQRREHDYDGGANEMSLNEAKAAYSQGLSGALFGYDTIPD